MLCETQKVLDFIGGADVDRTRDLLKAINTSDGSPSIVKASSKARLERAGV
jgi:hypothetical protein